MPRCLLILGARAVIRDVQTNQISTFNIIEEIVPQALPALIPDVAVLALWRSEAADGVADIPLSFRATNNRRQLLSTNLAIHFREANIHRTIVNISPLLIHEPGTLEFSFRRDDQVVASYEVEVRPVVQAAVVQAQAGQNPAPAIEPEQPYVPAELPEADL